MTSYQKLQDELSKHSADVHPSELHGQLIGYVCALQNGSNVGRRSALYDTWLDGGVSDALKALLEAEFVHALDNLGEYSDFEFSLMIPDDEEPIADRAESVGLWCSGFLSGFGESGRSIEGDDLTEAMRDLAQIAAMNEEVPEGEENEADLNEIVEFVRIGVLLIFAGLKPSGPH
ncbi:MAG: hypothetical protein ACI8Z1_000346 [Candidatus Azotimanducaceae bacterium]|jgi:uncharacterized protein YgfB (UPF0149 family)